MFNIRTTTTTKSKMREIYADMLLFEEQIHSVYAQHKDDKLLKQFVVEFEFFEFAWETHAEDENLEVYEILARNDEYRNTFVTSFVSFVIMFHRLFYYAVDSFIEDEDNAITKTDLLEFYNFYQDNTHMLY